MRLLASVVTLVRFHKTARPLETDRLRLRTLARTIANVSLDIEDERRRVALKLSNAQAWASGLVGANGDEYLGRPASQERELETAEGQMREAAARLAHLEKLLALCTALRNQVQQVMSHHANQSAAIPSAEGNIVGNKESANEHFQNRGSRTSPLSVSDDAEAPRVSSVVVI